MKALILAAGRGTRIRSVHGEHPKCLIQLDASGTTILDQQIASLLAAGVCKIGIVVGYEKEQIMGHVRAKYRGVLPRFHFMENERYAETNNIYSLWQARDWVNGEAFICLNADVVIEPRTLRGALRSKAPITMIVDPAWRDETMKVIIANDRVIRMSKGIRRDEFSGTYVGITAFSASVTELFFRRVEDLIDGGHVNDFFNTAVQQLADDGVRVAASDAAGLPWAEIDDPGDLAFAQAQIFPRLHLMAAAA